MTQNMNLQDAVQQAKESVSGIDDEELRKIAFDRVLQHLLDGGRAEVPISAPSPDPPKGAQKSSSAKSSKSDTDGPKAWLEELIDDGFFDEPKHGKEMVAALAERGHHLVYQDLTHQLETLTKDRKLRRKKMERSEDGRSVWHYSKW